MVVCDLKLGWSYCLRKGFKCANEGDYEAAVEHYKEAMKQDQDNAVMYNNLADAYLNLDQVEEAMTYAKKAIQIRPPSKDSPTFYVTLGEIHQAKGEHDEAIRCIERAQRIYEGKR